jgi:hypothetical protein
MTERDVREALAEALYRSDVNSCWDVAAALAPVVAQMLWPRPNSGAGRSRRGRDPLVSATERGSRRAGCRRGRPVSPCECRPLCACAGCEWQGGAESEGLGGPVAPGRGEVGQRDTEDTKAPQIGAQRCEGTDG